MARKRSVNSDYPQAPVVGRTIDNRGTHLDGARRFMASENIIVFANEKVGLARAASEVWLRPSANRRLGNYLDLNQRVGVAGFRIERHPSVLSLPGSVPENLLEHFAKVAEGTKRKVVDKDRNLELATCSFEADRDWPWHGTLAYDHVYALAGGERIVNEAEIRLRARQSAAGGVEIATVLSRPREYEAAQAWLNNGCAPNQQGWLATPFGLPTDPAERAAAYTRLLSRFKVGEMLRVSNPDVHQREKTSGEPSSERDPFLEILKQAPYKTKMSGLETILKRVEEDDGVLGGLTVYLKGTRGGEPFVASVQIRHRPVTDNQLEVRWNGARRLPSKEQIDLSDEAWDSLQPVGWEDDQKINYNLDAWGDVVTALIEEDEPEEVPAKGEAAANRARDAN